MQLFWTYSLRGASNYARNNNYWTYARSIKVCTEPPLLLLGVSTYARSNHYSRGVFARSIKVCIEQPARSIKVYTEQPLLDVHVYTRSTKVCTEQPNVAVYVWFKPPPPQYFNTDRSKAVLLLWFLTVTCSCCPYFYFGSPIMLVTYFSKMTTCLGKSCSFGLPRVPFVNCCQFMYLVISLLVLRAGCGI